MKYIFSSLNPPESAGVRWIPAESGGFQRSPVESSGFRSHSTGLRWSPWSPTGMGGALISTVFCLQGLKVHFQIWKWGGMGGDDIG
jgi:hypothetical protein